jgi:type IV fimbrial biogenesis protein FimT
MRFSKRTRGFSFFELLTVLAIIAILTQLTWPSWRHLFKGVSSELLLDELNQTLQFARKEAQLRKARITVCGSEDQETCSTNWERGFLVFRDSGGNDRIEMDYILQVVSVKKREGHLHWRAFPRSRAVCQFLPTGETPHENGTFWYCAAEKGEPLWALVLSQAGRLRVIRPNRQGRLQDEGGLLLSC